MALIVAADVKPRDVAAALAAATQAILGFASSRFSDAVDEHRAAVAELRAEDAALRALRAEEEARRIADTAEIEVAREEDRAEARAVAGALALEHVRRTGSFDDPAWVASIAPAGDAAEEGPATDAAAPAAEEPPAPRRKRKEKEAEEKAEGAAAGPQEPAVPAVLPPVRPEIVVSQAMLDRGGKKKKKDEKEAPAFAFTKAGDVFRLPSTELLDVHVEKAKDVDAQGLTRVAEVIVATLNQHGVEGSIKHIRPGPVVTLYEFSPVAGVKLARIENLDKELTMALSATRIRIIAPIPGKGVVGIEVPNKRPRDGLPPRHPRVRVLRPRRRVPAPRPRQEHRGRPLLRGSAEDASSPHRRAPPGRASRSASTP